MLGPSNTQVWKLNRQSAMKARTVKYLHHSLQEYRPRKNRYKTKKDNYYSNLTSNKKTNIPGDDTFVATNKCIAKQGREIPKKKKKKIQKKGERNKSVPVNSTACTVKFP